MPTDHGDMPLVVTKVHEEELYSDDPEITFSPEDDRYYEEG